MSFPARFVESAFFSPDSRRYWQAEPYGLDGTEFTCLAPSGASLSGLLLHAGGNFKNHPAGTVLYCHSGRMNREYNLPQAAFLAEAGLNVVLFDYEGYGHSGGSPSLDRLGEDAAAVVSWLDASPWKTGRIALFGQFVGADAALQYLHAHPDRVAGLLLESCYATRRGWVRDKWGPLLGDVLARFLQSDAVEPAQAVSGSHVPTTLICPGRDFVVHARERRAMMAALPPQADVWKADGCRFLGVFGGQRNSLQEKAVHFLRDKCLQWKASRRRRHQNAGAASAAPAQGKALEAAA